MLKLCECLFIRNTGAGDPQEAHFHVFFEGVEDVDGNAECKRRGVYRWVGALQLDLLELDRSHFFLS